MTENERNNLQETITHILEDMKKEEGAAFSLEKVNLAEMERRTGISRKKLRLIKTNGFKVLPNGNLGKSKKTTVLSGFTGVIDSYLKKRVRNSKTITDKLKDIGYHRLYRKSFPGKTIHQGSSFSYAGQTVSCCAA